MEKIFYRSNARGGATLAAGAMLMASTALCPSVAWAQAVPDAGTPAMAATAAPESAADENADILVTARRREERLQDVPVAITALGPEQLERLQAKDITNLSGVAPSLFIKQNPTTTVSTSLYIRGVGQDESHFTSENGVGLYIDGVFFPRASGSLVQLLDFESVQVLRGPQGTLFGKNSPAGAIVLTSRRPSTDGFSAKASFGLGSYSLLEGSFSINAPLSDTVAVKVDFGSRQQDGYVRNLVSGQTVNGTNTQAYRAALRWVPNADIEVLLSYDHSVDNSDTSAPTFVVGRTPQYPLFQTYVYSPFDRSQFFRGNGVSLNASYRVSPALTLKSISAYRDFHHILFGELIGIPGASVGLSRDQNQYQYSQELQANVELGRLSLVVGGLYFFENNKEKAYNQFAGAGSGDLYPISNQDSESLAFYAEGTYRFTDFASITVGGRYGHDKKTITRRSTNLPDGAGPVIAYDVRGLSRSWNEFTPRFIVDIHPLKAFGVDTRDDLLAYASYSRGYKAGAFDAAFTGNQAVASFIYDPEKVATTEFGMKAELANRRIILNAAYYSNKYDNYQSADCSFGASSTCLPASFNIDISGVELEGTFRPVKNLILSGSFATINDHIKSGPYVGRDLENTPTHTYSASAEYTAKVSSKLKAIAGVNYRYTDSYYNDLANGAEAKTDAYGLLGAHIAIAAEDERWQLRVYADNLTNKTYIVNALSGGSWWLGRPRSFGVRGSFKM